MDVVVSAADGDTVYHGLPLLEVLEKAGVETRSMAGQRKTATAIVVVRSRDGYTVVFSLGELLMHRSDPRVFLVPESAAGPLPENEGPVRLVVHGDRVRSSYALADVELRYIAQNPGPEPKR
jgi:Oxidoreductase molybdopterin binding domain